MAIFVLLNLVSIGQVKYINKYFEQQDGIYGLTGAMGVCLSPDQKNLYVTSQYALSVFGYDSMNGKLTFITSYKDKVDGFEGLYGANSVIVSNDNKNVYIVKDRNLSIMTRDTSTGLLTFYRLLTENQNGISGISIASCLVITKNDKYIFVSSEGGDCVTIFLRNINTGDLSFVQHISSHVSQPNCIKLSHDNRYAYLLSIGDPSIAVFSVDTAMGILTFIQNITNGQNGVSGLVNPNAFEISSDDKNLYVLGGNAVVSFTRNIINGQLTFLEVLNNNQNGVVGMLGCYAITLTPDKKSVFVASNNDSSVVTFNRDTISGLLSFVNSIPILSYSTYGNSYTSTAMFSNDKSVFVTSYWESAVHDCFRNEVTGQIVSDSTYTNGDHATIDGLYRANYACVSPDKRNVYVVSPYNGIGIFGRNDTTGGLSYIKNIRSTLNGVSRLYNAKCMFFSPNNMFAYIASSADSSIVIFNHDTATGDLTYSKSFKDINSISLSNIVISKDTNFVYASTNSGKLVTLQYDRTTGEMTYLDMFSIYSIDNMGGGIMKMQISNDNKYLFAVTNASSDALFMFVRDTVTGALIYKTRYHGSYTEFTNARILKPFTISNDCKNVYATSFNNNEIQRFNIINDSLVFVDKTSYTNTGISGLIGPTTIEIDKDDKFVYILSMTDYSLSVFDRNLVSGQLSFIKTYKEPIDTVDGLNVGNFITFSDDDKSFYVTSHYEHSIAAFKRKFFLGNDISACDGDTTRIEAGKFYQHYHWSTNDSLCYIKVTSSGMYSVTVTDSYGLSETDSINVIYHSLPIFDLGLDTTVCMGNSVTLSPNVNFPQYLWNNGSINNNIVVSDSGIYTLTVTDLFACSFKDSVRLNIWPLPVISLTDTMSICSGDTAQIVVNGTSVNYYWNNGMVGDTIVVNPWFNTTYYVTGTDINGCSNTSNTVVTVSGTPTTPTIYLNDTILFSDYYVGNQWYFNDTIITGAISQQYLCTLNGKYYVIRTINGCSSDTSNIIYVTNEGINGLNNNCKICIFPNPANGIISIDTSVIGGDLVEIYNDQGLLIKHLYMSLSDGKIDFSDLNTGMYLIRYINKSGKYCSMKIIKE